MKGNALLVPLVLGMLSLWSCDTGTGAGGTGSGTENTLGGMLVDEGGRPLPGAHAWLLPPERGPAAPGEALPAGTPEAVAGPDGRYAFAGLAGGRYNLQGRDASGALALYRLGIVHVTDSTEDLGTDTLRAPGAIRGRVVAPGGDPSGALCGIAGTSFLALADSAGGFLLLGVPQGTYGLTYRLPGYLPGGDSGVAVRAGRTTALAPETLVAEAPVPRWGPLGLRLRYDTAAGTVTLTWHPLPGAARYAVSAFPGLPGDPSGRDYRFRPVHAEVTDTVFVDTLARHLDFDTAAIRAAHPDSQIVPFRIMATYTVTGMPPGAPYAFDSDGRSVAVVTEPRIWSHRHRFDLRPVGLGRYDTVSLGDTVRLVAEYEDDFTAIDSLVWYRDADCSGAYEDSCVLAVSRPRARKFSDTLSVVVDAATAPYAYFVVSALLPPRAGGPEATPYPGFMLVVRQHLRGGK